MAFSIYGILSVLLEVIRPLLPILIAVLVIDAILLVIALKRGTLVTAGAIRLAALFGGAAAVLTFFIAPAFTSSSFANLAGVLDYLSLVGGALGVGVVVALLTWPPMALLQRS
ncbi:MAG: hypothetical protein EA419_09010 [Wenzhouxiangella sp.]|nr:MAG: hypothetical protein EA419_09010 [Wenzhouxiangella sp.]